MSSRKKKAQTVDMSSGTKPAAQPVIFNLPNQLTASRLVLSIVLFVFIALEYYMTSLVLFVLAASTDWLDGYFARKYGMVTVLGRILDPFVDKVIVCGTFIYLGAIPGSQVYSWMAVLIVARELLVTALRSFLEKEGKDFSANFSGKLKMVLQCVAAGFSLFYLSMLNSGHLSDTLQWITMATVWAAVISTVQSGIAYIMAAAALMPRR